jgi:hypothetical protein
MGHMAYSSVHMHADTVSTLVWYAQSDVLKKRRIKSKHK